jgi:Cytochrome P460
MADRLPDRYRVILRSGIVLWLAFLATGCGRVSSLSIGTVVAKPTRAADADHRPAQERKLAPQKPAADQASLFNSSDPRIMDIVRDYSKLRSMTVDRVFVNLELAMLCRGASAHDVAEARKKQGPHAHTSIRVFMNDLAADAFRQARARFPVGSIIVKEKSGQWYDPGGSELARESTHDGVGGMVKRSPGFDATHGDWEYFYFEDVSNVASGKISSCLGCHGGAASRDYVFGDWAKRH